MLYLDAAATTPVHPEVLAAMEPWLRERHGNPSSVHGLGVAARRALDEARERALTALGAYEGRFLVTSGATESNNLAVLGAARARRMPGRIVVTGIEHPSVHAPAMALEREGFEVVSVTGSPGRAVRAEDVLAACDEHTAVVACMLVNHETGTLQDVAAIARRLRGVAPRAHFHVDAVQAIARTQTSFDRLGCDSLSISAHKIEGPKGTGGLLLRNDARLEPLFHGGSQQQGLRPGTENVAGAIGLVAALEHCVRERKQRLATLWDRDRSLRAGLQRRLPDVRFHIDEGERAPGIVSVFVPGVPAQVLLHHLDARGLQASQGSACNASKTEPSRILLAMGVTEKEARQTLRLSFLWDLTPEAIERACDLIASTVSQLRSLGIENHAL